MVKELVKRYPALSACAGDIQAAIDSLISCYQQGHKLLLCGNGGSCADCLHIVGELMKGFLKKRPLSDSQKELLLSCQPELAGYLDKLQNALPAIALCEESALNTAFCNDVDPQLQFAQQVLGYGREGDILLAISTSGNAQNVVLTARTAKALGLKVVGLTGAKGGTLSQIADICIRVPETETYRVQELHLPVYHAICAAVEAAFYEM